MEAGGRLGAWEVLARLLRFAAELGVMLFHTKGKGMTTYRLHFQLHANQGKGLLQPFFQHVCSYGQKVLRAVRLDLALSFD